MNSFIYDDSSEYPRICPFGPSEEYIEYPFAFEKNSETNYVYQMVREAFKMSGYDSDNYGTKNWNPLGKFVAKGDVVLIKPNLVMHDNPAEGGQKGLDCLITHPSLVRCFVDYVYIALKGEGKIIIADAPVQNCSFDELSDKSGYFSLISWLKENIRGIDIEYVDMRETHLETDNGRQRQYENKSIYTGKIVDLNSNSFFANGVENKRLRVKNYDGAETASHHTHTKNEYCINEIALNADVIISLPKPKTHRIAGYTAALKNIVGINARKEYLPHHQVGSAGGKGDEYENTHIILKAINSKGNDLKNWALGQQYNWLTDVSNSFCRRIGKKLDKLETRDRKKFGMWYGNDTIWRTILDLNKIVYYADKDGNLANKPQRKIIYCADMIVCGEKEGPLNPSYKYVGGILLSDNPIEMDMCVTTLMGFDWRKMKTITQAIDNQYEFSPCDTDGVFLKSNDPRFNNTINKITDNFSFVATSGWREYLN